MQLPPNPTIQHIPSVTYAELMVMVEELLKHMSVCGDNAGFIMRGIQTGDKSVAGLTIAIGIGPAANPIREMVENYVGRTTHTDTVTL